MPDSLVEPKKLGRLSLIANALMVPLMYFLAGNIREKPQRTHAWTCQRLSMENNRRLDESRMVHCKAIVGAMRHGKWWNPMFHIPIFKGWRQYIVLNSTFCGKWHVGWKTEDFAEISLVSQVGFVRVLRGPKDVLFFGVDEFGAQITVFQIGEGRIGDGGPFCNVPLS